MDDQQSTAPVPCPPELIGIAHQLETMTPQARAAAASVLYGALASAMALGNQQPAPPLPPLTTEQQAVIDYLKKEGVTPAEELAHHTGYSRRTIQTWCNENGTLHAHGVVPTTKGYGIAPRLR
jgi:hypothetical protein